MSSLDVSIDNPFKDELREKYIKNCIGQNKAENEYLK